jgi:cytochrome c oxidase subunit 2
MGAVVQPSERSWWKEPIHKIELLWIAVILLWSILMFVMMPYWNVVG